MRAAPKTVQETSAVTPILFSGLGVGGPATPYPSGIEGGFVTREVVLVNSTVAVVLAIVTVVLAKVVWAAGTAGPAPGKYGKGRNRKVMVVTTPTAKLRYSVNLSTWSCFSSLLISSRSEGNQ